MADRIKIAHIIHRFDTGGLENGVVNLINRLDDSRYHHTIITMKGHNPEFAARINTGNVEFENLSKQGGSDIGVFLRLNRILKRLSPDILHTRNTATLEMQLVGWWRRVPLRIHGEHGWDVNDMHGQNRRYQKLRRFIKPFVHQYIALSKEAKDYLLDTISVKPSRVNHICNGVDHEKFVPDRTEKSGFVFGCVGRLEEVKNQQLLAKAFVKVWHHCQAKDLDVKLQIVGDGRCRDQIEGILEEGGCATSFWMPGNRSDVAELMQCFDVFILPSLAEGISNTILEAMSTGLAVIATDVGGNAELVKDSESGYIVPSNDAEAMAEKMIAYSEQHGLREAHGKAGRELVEQKFSLQAMTASYDELYRSVHL